MTDLATMYVIRPAGSAIHAIEESGIVVGERLGNYQVASISAKPFNDDGLWLIAIRVIRLESEQAIHYL